MLPNGLILWEIAESGNSGGGRESLFNGVSGCAFSFIGGTGRGRLSLCAELGGGAGFGGFGGSFSPIFGNSIPFLSSPLPLKSSVTLLITSLKGPYY